jgi:microcystin degradation protein MlrC
MKVVIAQFLYESNTFNPEPAEISLFKDGGTWLTEPGAILDWAQKAPAQMAGSLRALESAGWIGCPVFAAVCGSPAGRLSEGCFSEVRRTFKRAIVGMLPSDAILLHLHGAACAVGEDDVEGNLLEMIRNEICFRGPLVVSLDLHANVTRRIARYADAITAYRTMPHTDFFETGERAARLLIREDGSQTVTLVKMAALIPPTDTHHGCGPFSEILQAARDLEKIPGIEDVGIFPVQPWLDVEELGCSVTLTSTDPQRAASRALALADRWWAQRGDWRTGILDWKVVEAHLMERRRPGWVLVDAADATTGGSDGRSADAVRRLLPLADRLPGLVLLWVVDPQAVSAAEQGARALDLGRPGVRVEGEVALKGELSYRARGGVLTGCSFSLGKTILISAGRLRIVVSSVSTFGADPAFYECVGLDPESAQAVLAKSPMGWRAGFGAEGDRGLVFDGSGQTPLEFSKLNYDKAGRTIFPLTERPQRPVELIL